MRDERAKSREAGHPQSKLTISTQFEPLPVGYWPISFKAPLDGSIEYAEIVSDFSPETTMNRPVGSILKPRGCFSVGVLPSQVRLPVEESTLKAPSELLVRSAAYRNFPFGVR